MSFVYYGLYVLYKKILREKDHLVYISGLIAVSMSFIFTAIQLVFLSSWNVYVSSLVFLIFFYFFYKYLGLRQEQMLKFMSGKSVIVKLLAMFISYSFVFIGFWSFLGNGYILIREFLFR